MTMQDRFLFGSSFLRQAPDAAPSGGSPAPSSGSTPAATPSAPSSTPAPAASPSPSPEPTAPVSANSDNTGINFDVFFGDSESPEPAPTPKAPEVVPPKAPETPPVATAKPAEAPKPAEPTAAAPVAAAPSPTGDAPASSPPLDPSDPGSLARHLAENEEAMIAHVAKSMFSISDKEMEELETNVGEAIPKLLAKTFVKMQANMLQQVARLVPGMVQKTTEAVRKNAEGEARFFAAWPALKQELHRDLVQQYAGTYRQMHPQATFDQMIQDLGPLVMMAAKVSPTAVPPATTAVAPKSAPFIPSVPGATVISTSQVDEDSAVAALDPSRQE